MSVKYVGPHDAVEVAGQPVERGNTADFDPETEKSLLEQADNWQPAKPVVSKTEKGV